MKVIRKQDIINIYANGSPVIMLLDSRGNEIWSSGGGADWELQMSDYIIGEDGKYYEKFVDRSKAIDNNPIPDLNNQWVEDTVSGNLNIDNNFDYYMSNSNYHVQSSYSQFKVQWKGLTSITFLYRSYAESTYDYLVINGLDKPAFTSQPSYTTSGILAHTRGNQTTTYNTLTVECDEGEHSIWFCYVKDNMVDANNDRAFVGIPNNLTYYPEGSIKKGNELRYEYIKSNDVVITREGYGCFKYYKHYYTPDNLKDIITEEYILGEEEPLTPITRNYLRFDATNGDLHIGVNNLSLFNDLECAIDFEETWMSFPTEGVDIQNGQSIYLKGSGTPLNKQDERTFTTSVPCECHGNVMSLLSKDNFETLNTCTNYCFVGLFNNSKILTAPELPATTLADSCYYKMFNNCTSLVTAPELPATTLAGSCYHNMFNGCSSLVNAPSELPATTLAANCYYAMFNGCTKLVNVPSELPATTLADSCYQSMFQVCSSLVNAPVLPATNLKYRCYKSMFTNCSKLTTAPALPATTLAEGCYSTMFSSCTLLNKAPALPATTLTKECYYAMFSGCSNLRNAPTLPATTLAERCYNSMFSSCRYLNNIEIYATKLGINSCDSMFISCMNMKTLKCNLRYNADDSEITNLIAMDWLSNTGSSGTFYKNPDWAGPTIRVAETIPSTWAIEDWIQ